MGCKKAYFSEVVMRVTTFRTDPKLILGASTYCLLFQPWQEAVAALLATGFRTIELFADAPQAHVSLLSPEDRQALRILAGRYALSLHAPTFDLNIASVNPGSRREAVRQYEEVLGLAQEIGATQVVVHEGYNSYWKLDRTAAWGWSVEGLQLVWEIAKKRGVSVALENTNVGKFAMYNAWQEWMDLANQISPEMPLVLDIGHALLAHWDIPTVIRALGRRIVQVHIHDNGGEIDDHLLPGEGIADWPEIGKALQEAGGSVTLILEGGPLASAAELGKAWGWLRRWVDSLQGSI